MSDTTPHDQGDMVALGRIVKPHGVRGCVCILPFNPQSESFAELKRAFLKSPVTDGFKLFNVQRTSRHKQFFIIQLEGVDDLNKAQALRGWLIYVPKSELKKLDEDEYYYYELIDMEAYSKSGESLGRIAGIITTPAHDVLVIKSGDKEMMLPWIDGAVVDIDRENKRVVLETDKLVVESEKG